MFNAHRHQISAIDNTCGVETYTTTSCKSILHSPLSLSFVHYVPCNACVSHTYTTPPISTSHPPSPLPSIGCLLLSIGSMLASVSTVLAEGAASERWRGWATALQASPLPGKPLYRDPWPLLFRAHSGSQSNYCTHAQGRHARALPTESCSRCTAHTPSARSCCNGTCAPTLALLHSASWSSSNTAWGAAHRRR